MGTIYIATNMVSGKAYIGKTIQPFNKRMKAHAYDAKVKRYGSVFHRAIRKYGIESFDYVNVEIPDNDLDEAEQMFIDDYKEVGITLYNMTSGGTGGATNTGKTFTKEHKEKISKANKGRKLSKKHREKLSQAKIGYTPWHKGKKCPTIAAAKQGAKNPAAKEVVLICPNGKEKSYKCLAEAARDNGLDNTCLSKVALGKYKKHKGYKARYI
jgi:group I intron endonuclease